YVALARGNFSRVEGSIQHNIKRDSRNRKRFVTCGAEEGRTALTHYRVLRQFPGYALVRINIHTGRTHQIRVHLASLGHPLIGDVIYGKEDATTLMLHALELQVDHPVTDERLTFRSPLPLRFLQYVKGVRK
ncbi:MAG TPA: pseudouridine synthase, partial [Sphaerochaeta sp.]|nr:pseudouridine synthase [Sphaerochaeta sp.]